MSNSIPSKSLSCDQQNSPSQDFSILQNQNFERQVLSSPKDQQQNSPARLYMKITHVQKQQLFTMVQKNGLTIKEAAQIIGIKYATAKTIIYHQRIKKKAKKNMGIKICGYTELKTKGVSKLKIISTTASDITHSQEYRIY